MPKKQAASNVRGWPPITPPDEQDLFPPLPSLLPLLPFRVVGGTVSASKKKKEKKKKLLKNCGSDGTMGWDVQDQRPKTGNVSDRISGKFSTFHPFWGSTHALGTCRSGPASALPDEILVDANIWKGPLSLLGQLFRWCCWAL